MDKVIYLTTNKGKFEEAERLFKKYGIDIEIATPDFEIPEIQAKTCGEVVAFSCKYMAEKLGRPCVKSDSGLYLECLGGLPGPYNHDFDHSIGVEHFLELIKNETNRKARLEDTFAYCEPGKEPVVFEGLTKGRIDVKKSGTYGWSWDFIFIPEGEDKPLGCFPDEERWNFWSVEAYQKLAKYLDTK